MNEEDIVDGNISDQFVVTDTAHGYLLELAKWAKFLAIVGFVFVGLIALMAIFAGTFFGALMSGMGEEMSGNTPFIGAGGGAFLTILYLGIAALYFFPTLYLYRFATRTKQALLSEDSALLAGGLEQLKSCFKFMGIMMIVVLAFYALGILFMIIGGAMAL